MDWTPFDYAVAAALIGGVAVLYALTARMSGHRAYRAAVGVALAAAFVMVWVNLAVGIIGNEANPANLMFAGVLAVGLVGALVARFRAPGMVRALVATAVAQALVGIVTLVAGLDLAGVAASAFFAGLWLLSAWLFRKAARKETTA